MEMVVKAVLESMDENTREAIEQVPKNIAVIAEKLSTIDRQIASLRIEVRGHAASLAAQMENMQNELMGKFDPAHTPEIPAAEMSTYLAVATPRTT